MASLTGKCWWTISVFQCALFFSLLYMISISTSINSSSLELCARLDCSLKTHCKHTQFFQEWMYLARCFRSQYSMLSARPSNPKFCCPRCIKFSEKVGVWISSSIYSRSRLLSVISSVRTLSSSFDDILSSRIWWFFKLYCPTKKHS